MFKEILQEICPCHSVSLVLPDKNMLMENSADLVTEILNLLSFSPRTSSSSAPLPLSSSSDNSREAEVAMLTGGMNDLIIENKSEPDQRCDIG